MIRASSEADLPGITEIYRHHVLTGLGSFEEEPPDVDEIARRRAEVLALGLPHLVAADDATGAVLGFAYAARYRPRSAYRFTLEDSIYVAPAAQRRGIGRTLLAELIERCTALGYRQLIAVIGDSGNAPSIGLHLALGFRRSGVLEGVGWKFARWVDIVILERALGPGSAAPPP